MITYAERRCFQSIHTKLFRHARKYVTRIPDYWGNELRCHELARAVHAVLHELHEPGYKLEVVDGRCGPVEHSWLSWSDGVILDVYAPGRLPAVQLVDPLVGAYRPGTPRQDIKQSIVNQLVFEIRGK